MSTTAYYVIGVINALAVLAAMMPKLAEELDYWDDLGDVARNVSIGVTALLVAALAGVLWPGTLAVMVLFTLVAGYRKWDEVRRRPTVLVPVMAKYLNTSAQPPSDAEKYARMAREQRNLARGSRDNGWEDTAAMQDQLAEQYEQLSRMYERTTP